MTAGKVKVSFLDGTVRTIVSAVEDAKGRRFLIDAVGNRLPIERARSYRVLGGAS